MKKKIFLFMFILLFLKINYVQALTYRNCNYSDISRLKSLVTNVNISYDYYISGSTAYFNITINNIPDNVYIKDTYTGNVYKNFNNNELIIRNYYVNINNNSVRFNFYSTISNCDEISLGSKYVKFPIYNIYYNDSVCSEIPDFSLCQKWVSRVYSTSEFNAKVDEYKANLNKKDDTLEEEIMYEKTFLDKIIQFYVKHYYILLSLVITICIVIIIISRRKNRFKL